jgi:AmiR/NasT family two-component response regulator
MNKSLQILVADDERDTRDYLKELLTRRGHQVVTASSGKQLVELCRAAPPDLIITDVRMPDMDGIEAAEVVTRQKEVPIILVTGHHAPDLLERVGADHVMAYLVKPIQEQQLEAAVILAMKRFEQYQAIRHEAATLRQALEDRKVIERAKGVVMRRLGLNEEESFRRLRKLSSDQNRKVVDVAQQVLRADEVFHAMERN